MWSSLVRSTRQMVTKRQKTTVAKPQSSGRARKVLWVVAGVSAGALATILFFQEKLMKRAISIAGNAAGFAISCDKADCRQLPF